MRLMTILVLKKWGRLILKYRPSIASYCKVSLTIGLSMKMTLLWLIPGRDIAADPSLGLLRRIGVAGLVRIGATVAE